MRSRAAILRELDALRMSDTEVASRRTELMAGWQARQKAARSVQRRLALAQRGHLRRVALTRFIKRHDAAGIGFVLRALRQRDRKRAAALEAYLARPAVSRAVTSFLAPVQGYLSGASAVLTIGPRASLSDARRALDQMPRSEKQSRSSACTVAEHGWSVTLRVPHVQGRSGRVGVRSMWHRVERHQAAIQARVIPGTRLTRRRSKRVPEAKWVVRHLLGDGYAAIAGSGRSRQVVHAAVRRFWLERGIADYASLRASVGLLGGRDPQKP